MNGSSKPLKCPIFNAIIMKYLIFSFLLTLSLHANAHEFFFGFAEVEYNDMSRTFEATLVFTAHDVEKCVEGLNIPEGSETSSDDILKLSEYINKTFSISCGNNSVNWSIVGVESFLNGTVNIYIISQEIEITNELNIKFNSLMERFENQQNKITLLFRGESFTKAFLKNDYNKTIKLES